jgi:hypothetical protein
MMNHSAFFSSITEWRFRVIRNGQGPGSGVSRLPGDALTHATLPVGIKDSVEPTYQIIRISKAD